MKQEIRHKIIPHNDMFLSYWGQQGKGANVTLAIEGTDIPEYNSFFNNLEDYAQRNNVPLELRCEIGVEEDSHIKRYNMGVGSLHVTGSKGGEENRISLVIYSSLKAKKSLDDCFGECFTNLKQIMPFLIDYVDVSFLKKEMAEFSVEKLPKSKVKIPLDFVEAPFSED